MAVKYGQGEIGRTKLQKMVYFINKYLSLNINDFRLHHYGPYSPNVSAALKTITNSFLTENDAVFGYSYKLTADGQLFLDYFENALNDLDKRNKIERMVKKLSSYSKEQLELLSTMEFVENNNENISNEEVFELVSNIKTKSIEEVRSMNETLLNLKSDIMVNA